jgi:hypothetical protein
MQMTVASHEGGYLIVTDDAILGTGYLSQDAQSAARVGGIVGAAIMTHLENRKAQSCPDLIQQESLSSLEKPTRCLVRELPESVLQSNDWPQKLKPDKSVVIYPRCAISEVRVSIWCGVVIYAEGRRHVLGGQLWQIKKLKRHLLAAKYPVK